ncbi:FxsA family protein [Corynebacterium epidermidicanis]|uniref:Protein affecting phage T7 exclusion by the F plasmid n=1 Tax=Corynebacterium epidermidicanis TaxID=1050174 RepID=A0A0G3GRD6_9CORY|nr:FxsA family protein [Corynebacterium epidermidicanis]AKK03115.1 protein affecting phage T7 exclusion by the F plasmid [Corynebacterium epidermidicanis]
MPIVIFLAYLVLEALAFWAVSQLIGVGWAFVALFLLLVGGIVLAGIEMKQVARAALSGQRSAGGSAVDYGLITAGSIGVAVPGFLTSIMGIFLIIAPTRALVRAALARKAKRFVEELGMRGFEAAGKYRASTSYGSFGSSETTTPGNRPNNDQVIDEEPQPSDEDISSWAENIDPDDFTGPGSDKPSSDGPGKNHK